MDRLSRYTRIHWVFMKQYFKILLEYRAEFIVGFLSFFLVQFSGIFFLYLVFRQIPILDGWSLDELILMYGMFQLPRAIDHTFTDPIWWLPGFVRRGELDRFLVRPINPFFQLIAQKLDYNALGELAVGIAAITYALNRLDVTFSIVTIIVLIVYIVFGALIYTAVKLFFGTVSFYTMVAFPIMSGSYSMSNYAQYPLTIYPGWLKKILHYFLPFAFTAYYPTLYLLGKNTDLKYLFLCVAVSLIAFTVAYSFFKYSLSKYQSAGS